MDSKEFKKSFDGLAKRNGFDKAFGGWFKESQECISVIDLQKSNYGDYFDVNIKIFVQGMFGNTYIRTKELVKIQTGDIFFRQPNEYKEVLDFDKVMNVDIRKHKLEALFSEFIVPVVEKSLTRSGLKELSTKGKILLLPAVKDELI